MEHNESQKLVAWMPATGRRAATAQLVGAVLVPLGQELADAAMYLAFLADRVQKMLEREPNPEQSLRELVNQLDTSGLMSAVVPNKQALKEKTAGHALVVENPAIRMRLAELGVPGKLPKKIYGGNPQAKKLVEETDLWMWLAHVLNQAPVGLR